jgi:hypothetical protein
MLKIMLWAVNCMPLLQERKKEMIVLMEGGVAHENNSTRLRNQRSSAFGGGAED